MAILAAIPMAFIPAFFFSWFIYWLDRYEKEPRWLLLATFFWGGFVAIIGTLIIATIFEIGFSIVLNDAVLEDIAGGSITAPLVEEFMKGLAVMIVFFMFRKEFDSILDGIIYGGIAGLGFAATENVFYFLGQYNDAGWAGMFTNFALRVGVFAWGIPSTRHLPGLALPWRARTGMFWSSSPPLLSDISLPFSRIPFTTLRCSSSPGWEVSP